MRVRVEEKKVPALFSANDAVSKKSTLEKSGEFSLLKDWCNYKSKNLVRVNLFTKYLNTTKCAKKFSF